MPRSIDRIINKDIYTKLLATPISTGPSSTFSTMETRDDNDVNEGQDNDNGNNNFNDLSWES